MYGLQEVERVEALERQADDIRQGFRGQWAASGASGAKRLEAEQRDYLATIRQGDRDATITEPQAADLIRSMRAHRGSNKRVS